MPLCFDPNATIRIALDGDKDCDPMPYFVCKALTMRQQTELGGRLEELATAKDVAAAQEMVLGILDDNIVGWANMGSFVYDKTTAKSMLQEFLSRPEAMQLAYRIMAQASVTPEQKKS